MLKKPIFARTKLHMEVGYASKEFTSAFEIRENTAKYNLIHGFQQRPEGMPHRSMLTIVQALQAYQQTRRMNLFRAQDQYRVK